MEIPKYYDPRPAEARWNQHWLDLKLFEATADPDRVRYPRGPYSVVIPPPNVTGVLHMGHMLNNTIQDVLVRRKRQEGYNALWVPGTDHASIATEARVVNQLREQGITKQTLIAEHGYEGAREKFLEHAWAWTHKYGGIILEQLKALGASADWRRTRFTLEPSLSQGVIDTFVKLYSAGLIYRGQRMINWDPQARTGVSDEEVQHREGPARLYYVRYELMDGQTWQQDGQTHTWLTVATTRPETIPADTALAVHPTDERYRHLVGGHVRLPLTGRPIPIIADEAIDPAFGTGCLKVTPAHSEVDFAIGQRHSLPLIDILAEDGSLTSAVVQPHHEALAPAAYAPLVGLDRAEARTQVAALFQAAGCLVKAQDITNSVGYSERTGAVIEPRLSTQWFVRMADLARPALQAVTTGEVTIIPERFVGVYRHWMENVRDWNISRQLWWGHRIPAWYLSAAAEGQCWVAATAEEAAALATVALGRPVAPHELHQDPDVLDTWFSSWLWPITVFDGLKDPQNPDFQYFYPTSHLVTAPEILFFWVARMIMAGQFHTGRVPFSHVYLHGIVRDAQGRKMSKSLGNSPDPLALMAQYGADGVRMGMLLAAPAGNDLLFDESLCQQGSAFCNKLWNAYRLVKGWEDRTAPGPASEAERLAQQWLSARTAQAEAELDQLLGQFRLSEALMLVYRLVWDDFCAWYLELVKPAAGASLSQSAYEGTVAGLERLLLLLHPFMPFVTEEVWQGLRPRAATDSLAALRWQPLPAPDGPLLEQMARLQQLAAALRGLRAEKSLPMSQLLEVYYRTGQPQFYAQWLPLIERMVGLGSHSATTEKPTGAVTLVVGPDELYVPLTQVVDAAAERARLLQEQAYTEGFLTSVRAKLGNERFVSSARPEVVAKERQKEADALAKLQALAEALAGLEP